MESSALVPGDVVAGKLVVEKVLGSGGMGVVVAARHRELGERVAIKVLRGSSDAHAIERMRREARASAKLRGEHIVRVMDVGTLEDGAPYIVMEYVAGRTLAFEREAKQRIPIATAVDWVLQACEGLAEAHAAGIVHRDIKPSNLLLTTRLDGTPLVKLLDFGIAKSAAAHAGTLTETGGFIGSPLYASPEQVRDARLVDARTDIWSLGVVLYELVTGRLPFPSFTATAALASLVADPPVPPRSVNPEVPEALEQLLLRCLEKLPAARFQDMGELARALEPFGSASATGAASRVERVLRSEGRAPLSEPPPQLGAPAATFALGEAEALAMSRNATEMRHHPASSGLRAKPFAKSRSWLFASVPLVVLGLIALSKMRESVAPTAPVIAKALPVATRPTLPDGSTPAPSLLALTPASVSVHRAPVSVPPAAAHVSVPRASTTKSTASARPPQLPPATSAIDVDFGPRK